MGELKHRKHLNTTLPLEMYKEVHDMADQTKINISRLAEEAWEDLIKKYIKKRKYKPINERPGK